MTDTNHFEAMQDRLVGYIKKNSYIDPALYQEHNVKRGLRNSNGTGVLVGITKVSNVVGYQIDSGVKVPVDGKLFYRGISLTDLVTNYEREDRFGYEVVAFLLLFGELPTPEELKEFRELLIEKRQFPNSFAEDVILKSPSENIMNKLQRTVLALYSYDENAEDISLANVLKQSVNLIAKMPLMIGYAYQAKQHYYGGQSLVLHMPKDGGTAENILHLIRADKDYSKEEAQLLDTLLIVHADHGGGNNSAFATHVVSSSGTDTYSAISTSIGSLKGPKHGGANLMVASMIEDIKETVPNWHERGQVMDYLRGILKKERFNKTGLVYGMGHAVYTFSDPRAHLLKEKAAALARVKGFDKEYELLDNIETGTKELMAEKGRLICVL